MGTLPIAAVILQYGNWQKTAQCIESLWQSTHLPRWIIVVDNASPDDSAQALEAWLRSHGQPVIAHQDVAIPPAPLLLLKRDSNGGYAAGNNAGIQLGMEWGAQAFLLLNNDTRLAPPALNKMWHAILDSPGAGLCGATIVYPYPHEPLQCCAGGHTNYFTGLSTLVGEGLPLHSTLPPREVVESRLNFICGACVLVSRPFIASVGLMDEGYFLYCEEQDWVLRAKGQFRLVYAPEAICYHEEGSSTGWNRHSCSWKQGLRLLRSRLRLARIHHPHYLPFVALGSAYAAGRLLLRRTAATLNQHFKPASPRYK